MECQARIRLTCVIGILKSGSHKLRAVSFSYLVAHQHTREQVNDHANLIGVFAVLEICNVTNPHFIGLAYVKLLVQVIFILASFALV